MWGQIAAFAAPKVLNFLKGKAQDKVMGAVNNRLQGGGGGGGGGGFNPLKAAMFGLQHGGGGSSFGVDQSGGGGVDYGSGNARYESSKTMDPESLGIRQEALNQLRGMGGNLEGNLAAADAEAERLRAIAIDQNVKAGPYAQGATRGQYLENQVNTDLINTRAGIRAADQAQQLERARLMGTLGVEGAGQVDYGRETSPWEKVLGGVTTGLGLYNQMSPDKGLFERLGLSRDETDDSSVKDTQKTSSDPNIGFNLSNFNFPSRYNSMARESHFEGRHRTPILPRGTEGFRGSGPMTFPGYKGFNFMNSLRKPRFS